MEIDNNRCIISLFLCTFTEPGIIPRKEEDAVIPAISPTSPKSIHIEVCNVDFTEEKSEYKYNPPSKSFQLHRHYASYSS